MSMNLSPGIVTNGLIFNYDMHNTKKSFNGAPTTNLVSGAAAFSGWSNYWRTDYINTFTTEFGTTGYRITGNPSWNGVYTGISLPSTGTYTFSVWIRYWGGTSSNNGGVAYISGWGGGDSASGIDKSLIGVWQRASITLNCTNTSMTFYIISYGGDSSGRADCSTWDITMPQVESGSFATGFVDGTRSNTQALIDLSNNNAITASSLTYASNGTFSFNGSSNYITVPASSILNMPNTFTLEAWVKPNSATSDRAIIILGTGSYYLTIDGAYKLSVYCYGKSPEGYHTTSDSVSQGVWNHICAAWSSGEVSLYINGQLKTSISTSGTPNGVSSQVWIGAEGSGSTRQLNGSIGIAKIYNRTLSAGEVQQNFNAVKTQYTPGSSAINPALNATQIRAFDPSAPDGSYWYQPSGYSTPILCYTNFSTAPAGKGYVLVATGRESTNWWDNNGQNTVGLAGATGQNTPISVAPGSFVNGLIGGNWNLMKMLVNRINGNDSWYFQGTTSATFSWAYFPQNASSVNASATKYSGLFKNGSVLLNWATGSQWTDTLNIGGGNDCDRTFTWSWGGHGSWQGWSGGSSCTPAGSFQNGGEGHAIQLVNCYIEC
jgi:hypothetical protein